MRSEHIPYISAVVPYSALDFHVHVVPRTRVSGVPIGDRVPAVGGVYPLCKTISRACIAGL